MTEHKFSNKAGVIAAEKRAAVHLLPPHENEAERGAAAATAAALVMQAVEHAVRADLPKIALRLHDMAIDLEAQAPATSKPASVEPEKPRRKWRPTGSPGERYRKQLAKRGAISVKL